MSIERLKKRASEKEPIARPSSNKVSLEKQKLAELLRSRIEELDRRLAILNSERGLFEKLLRMDDSRSSKGLSSRAQRADARKLRCGMVRMA